MHGNGGTKKFEFVSVCRSSVDETFTRKNFEFVFHVVRHKSSKRIRLRDRVQNRLGSMATESKKIAPLLGGWVRFSYMLPGSYSNGFELDPLLKFDSFSQTRPSTLHFVEPRHVPKLVTFHIRLIYPVSQISSSGRFKP